LEDGEYIINSRYPDVDYLIWDYEWDIAIRCDTEEEFEEYCWDWEYFVEEFEKAVGCKMADLLWKWYVYVYRENILIVNYWYWIWYYVGWTCSSYEHKCLIICTQNV
jgi:hypothetical protein